MKTNLKIPTLRGKPSPKHAPLSSRRGAGGEVLLTIYTLALATISAAAAPATPPIAQTATASATAADTTAVTTYQDPDGAYALRVPRAWKTTYNATGIKGGSVAIFSQGGAETPGLSLWVLPMRFELNTVMLDSLGKSLVKSFTAVMTKGGAFTAADPTVVTFSGRPAMRLDFTFRKGGTGVPQHGYIVILLARHNMVEAGISAPNSDAAGLATAQTALQSLALDSAVPADPIHPMVFVPAPDSLEAISAENDAVIDQNNFLVRQQGEQTHDKHLKPMDLAQARAAYDAAQARRHQLAAGTLARYEATNDAVDAAGLAGWATFDSGNSTESAIWFDRRAALKQAAYDDVRAYHEALLASASKRLAALRAATPNHDTREQTAILINALDNQLEMRANVLEDLANTNGRHDDYLRYAQMQLAMAETQLRDAPLEGPSAEYILQRQLGVAEAHEDLAFAFEDQARYAESEAHFKQALALRKALPADFPRRGLTSPLLELGHLLNDQGDLKGARDYYLQAVQAEHDSDALQAAAIDSQTEPQLKLLLQVERLTGQVTLLRNLGSVADDMGDYKTANDDFEQALAQDDKVVDDNNGTWTWTKAQMRAATLTNQAVAHHSAGELDVAMKEDNEAIALWRELDDDDDWARTLFNLATIYDEKNDVATTRRDVEQARRILISEDNLRGVISSTQALAVLAEMAHQLPQAAAYAQQALAIATRLDDAGWIGSTQRIVAAICIDGNQLDAAWRALDRAAAADLRTGSPTARAATLLRQGMVLEKRGDLNGAYLKFRDSIELRESIRATAASAANFDGLQGNYKPYEFMVRLLIKMHRGDEAFDYLNRAKSKALEDSLNLSSLKSKDPALQALLDRAAGLKSRLASAQSQIETEKAKPDSQRDDTKIQNLQLVIASTQGEFFRVSDQIRDANSNYDKVLSVKPRELKKAQAGIPPGVIFVEYAPLGDRLYVLLVTHDSLKIYTPPVKTDDLYAAIRQFRKLIDGAKRRAENGEDIAIADWMSNDPNVAPLRDNITALYAMLIAPIQPEIDKAQTIAFIPTQLLYYLPIHALAHKQGNGLRFLIEDKQVVYLAGSDVMGVLQDRATAQLGTGMLAFGDPDGADLPNALTEVHSIAGVFPSTQVLTGALATKSSATDAKNLDVRVLHFATHGYLNPSTPDKSYIQLAAATNPADGELSVGEVYDLDLKKVDLVTLSACQTALGEREPDGTEITSLAESFSAAGAASVLASLWSVADSSTKDTMETFYRDLAAGKTKAAALQDAQVKMLRNPRYGNPFYWAPFELMGDWR